jgi:hypothetical protein
VSASFRQGMTTETSGASSKDAGGVAVAIVG